MDNRVLRRLTRGFSANAYGQIITAIVQLLGVPVLINAWGMRQYGEWLVLFAMPAYLSMSDLGLAQSAGNDMTASVKRGDRSHALAVFQSLIVFVGGVAIVGLCGSGLLLSYVGLPHWLHLETMDGATTRWVLWLLTAQVFVNLLNSVSHTAYRASGDYALHTSLTNTVRLCQYLGIWAAALLGAGPLVAAAIFCLVRALGTALMALLLLRRHSWIEFNLHHARLGLLRQLLKPASASVAIPLSQALVVQGMTLVIASTLGAVAVVTFSTIRTLTRLALQLVNAVSNAAEPELAAAWGHGDLRLMREMFSHSLRASAWLSMGVGLFLAIFWRTIIQHWTSGQVQGDVGLFAWLLVSAVASVLWSTGMSVLRATNRHFAIAGVSVVAATASLAMARVLMLATSDLAGAAAALLLMDLTLAVAIWISTSRLLNIAPAEITGGILDPRPLLQLFVANRGASKHQANES